MTTTTTPTTLAPHAPGEPLHSFGLRALTFLAAHGTTATGDTLQRAAQCYQLVTAEGGDTPAAAERRAQADRLLLSLIVDAPATAASGGSACACAGSGCGPGDRPGAAAGSDRADHGTAGRRRILRDCACSCRGIPPRWLTGAPDL